MSTTTCDCTKGNEISDLEALELKLQLASTLAGLITGVNPKLLAAHIISVPDVAVKFVDALQKSTESFAYRDTTVTLKDTVAVLPDYRGAGRVENLSVAMNEIKIEREVA